MQMNPKPIKVSIVGSGNVATRLCYAFKDAEVEIVQLLSKSESGKNLSELFDIELITSPEEMVKTDVVLLCIKDDTLEDNYFSKFDKALFLCHTSGSVGLNVFKTRANAGVFYPLQTFSKAKEVEFQNIPLCLEAKQEKDLKTLEILSQYISNDIRIINSEERKQIHLAAVFVSNFVNHLYKIAEDLLKDNNLDFDILKPLIKETAEKVQFLNPNQAQTGPALRKDKKIIEKHLKMLGSRPDYQDIYNLISKSITKNN